MLTVERDHEDTILETRSMRFRTWRCIWAARIASLGTISRLHIHEQQRYDHHYRIHRPWGCGDYPGHDHRPTGHWDWRPCVLGQLRPNQRHDSQPRHAHWGYGVRYLSKSHLRLDPQHRHQHW